MSEPSAGHGGPPPSRWIALSQLLTLPNLGLNLFFALAFLLVATHGRPAWWTALLVLLAFFGARSAGHAFNQIVDRRFDAENPRTQGRPLVAGTLSMSTAWGVFFLNVGLFVLTAFLLRPWLVLLALPALALFLGYSLTKRWTALTTVVLGTVQALLPAGVYLAVDGTIPAAAWLAVGALVLFGTAFECVHSLGDLASDRDQGLRSLPLSVGERATPWLVLGLLVGAWLLLTPYGILAAGASKAGFVGAMLVLAGVMVWEVHGLLARKVPLPRLFRAHFAMGALFLVGVLLSFYGPAVPSSW